jgi:hypothetical protein
MDSLSRVAVQAIVRRLATALVVLVLGGLTAWCGEALAVGTVSSGSYTATGYKVNNCCGWFPTKDAACSAAANNYWGVTGATYQVKDGEVNCYRGTSAYAATASYWMGSFTTQAGTTFSGCPANSTGTSTCTCNSGYVPNSAGTACEALSGACSTIISGANSLEGYNFVADVAAAGGTAFCTGGCSIEATQGFFRKNGAAWVGTFYGPFTAGTATCSETSVPEAATTPTCPAGQMEGTVNGTTVCVPATVTAEKSSSAASAPAGSASAPSAVSTPDGTEVAIPPGGSVTRETTCDAGGCTTTTRVKDGGGSLVGKFDDTKPKDTFCKENPETTICKSTSFSSTCAGAGATQACDGDAIQCAIAKDQLLRHCQLFDQTGTTKTIGDDAMARGDTRASDHPGATANIETASMGPTSFDQTDLIGNTCPADQTIAVGSSSVVMPWSQLCTPAQWLGTILVGITALACVFIAFKQG